MAALLRLLLILGALLAAPVCLAEGLAVIVNPSRAMRLERDELARIYLKKRLFWSDGDAILPVNHSAGAEEREAFEKGLFGAAASRLAIYWNQAYFQGVLPPATLASDEAVRLFVAREPRAIGYVRASAVDDTVHVVFVLDTEGAE